MCFSFCLRPTLNAILVSAFRQCFRRPVTDEGWFTILMRFPALTSPYRNRVTQREAERREVITDLALLVSANSEPGFKQCLPLAYGLDLKKRLSLPESLARPPNLISKPLRRTSTDMLDYWRYFLALNSG